MYSSKGELLISRILSSSSVSFVQEKTFSDLNGFRNVKLRYDFYGTYKGQPFLIEVQGEEHYKFIPYFHKRRADFQKRQIYDEKKISYALAHKIKLYCIPFWDLDKISTVKDIFKEKYLARSKNHNYQAYRAYLKTL